MLSDYAQQRHYRFHCRCLCHAIYVMRHATPYYYDIWALEKEVRYACRLYFHFPPPRFRGYTLRYARYAYDIITPYAHDAAGAFIFDKRLTLPLSYAPIRPPAFFTPAPLPPLLRAAAYAAFSFTIFWKSHAFWCAILIWYEDIIKIKMMRAAFYIIDMRAIIIAIAFAAMAYLKSIYER